MRHFTPVALLALAGTQLFAQKQLKPKTPKEGQAINAILQAQDPDARIKAADELIKNFADTDFKAFALELEAESYLVKGDNDKAIVFGEQTLEVDPKNYQAAVLLAKAYAITTRVNDLDKEEKLTKAVKYANLTLELIKTAEKPNAQLPDAQWTEVKNDIMGQAYLALGISAAFHNKMDDVTADFQKVSELDSDPTDLIRGGRVLLDTKKYEQAVTWFDKAASAPNANAQIKDIAAKDKARAQAMVKK
jgi:tetratricopeptide (TPR) repeat protein